MSSKFRFSDAGLLMGIGQDINRLTILSLGFILEIRIG